MRLPGPPICWPERAIERKEKVDCDGHGNWAWGVCVAAIALQAGRWVISPMAIPRFITTTRTIYRVLC